MLIGIYYIVNVGKVVDFEFGNIFIDGCDVFNYFMIGNNRIGIEFLIIMCLM